METKQKLIRELRMGPPKSGKTIAVVGTYPKPLLVFLFDNGGVDVIPTNPATTPPAKDRLPLEVSMKDVKYVTPNEFAGMCKLPPEQLPKITVVDFGSLRKMQMTEQFIPVADSAAYNAFYNCTNYLVQLGCPWKTIVVDSVTSLCDTLLSFVTEKQVSWLSDARKWSPAIGGKVLQNVATLCTLKNSHCVFIAHSHMEKNELDQNISIVPLGPSSLSEKIGGLVSQYLYATNESGKLEVYTSPKGNVKAIGCRWPSDLPVVCLADFKSIYGKELLV